MISIYLFSALMFSSWAQQPPECHIQIGATYRPVDGNPVDSDLPDNFITGFFKTGANFRASTWQDCYAIALREAEKLPIGGRFRVRNCARFCGSNIDGAGDTPGAYFISWSLGDKIQQGKVSLFTHQFVSEPMTGDQRFHQDGSLYN